MNIPRNAGKTWTASEDAELLRSFAAGVDVDQLARRHGRTQQAIYGRLYRLGQVPAWQPGANIGRSAHRVLAHPRPHSSSPEPELQTRLDGLNAAARALVLADFSADELPTILRAEIERLQQDIKEEVIFRDGRSDGQWFSLANKRSGDLVRVRKPNDVRFLSGQIDGVWIVVNLHKVGLYRHANARVAKALRALADAIDRTTTPLADHDQELRVEPLV